MKIIDSKATSMRGTLRIITINIEDRTVYTIFKTVLMDELWEILGVKFMRRAQVVLGHLFNSSI